MHVMIRRAVKIFVVLCCIISLHSFAQTATMDSLHHLLRKLPQDTNRINALIELSAAQRQLNADSVLSTAEKALALSQDLDYYYGVINAYSLIAYAYNQKGKLLKASE